ncbi:ATP-binding protein [Streptomyces sasae]|uniref:ATP-binding protein n=1 Tax=Streptomyces sasae TaxID=1266772 RepID=UPI002930FECC|nr:ATP-binding protein [Streptomyces sasae]
MLVSDDGRVIEWSASAQETFGLSPQEAVGRRVGELVRDGNGVPGAGVHRGASVSLAVRPILTGSALVWEVGTGGGPDDGWTSAVLQTLSTCSPMSRAALVPVPEGPVLAGSDHAPFPAATVELPEGSILALGNEDLLAPSGLVCPLLAEGVYQSLEDVCDTIAYALRDRHETEKLLLLARVRAFPADRVLVLPLPAEEQAAPLARAATRRQLEAWNIGEEDAFTAEIIVSELVGNAVRYGAPPLGLRLVLDHHLTCEVSDAAQCAPHLKHARTVDEDGRGLFIIASLAGSWGTRYCGNGKKVWAQQSMSPAP